MANGVGTPVTWLAASSVTSAIKRRYAQSAAQPVENDIDALFKAGLKVVAGRLALLGEKARQDPAASAAVVLKLAQEGRLRRNARP